MDSRTQQLETLEANADSPVSAVDLFCGAGGLTHGLLQAGIKVEAGIDIDEQARHAFVANNPGVGFLAWDVGRKNYTSIQNLFAADKYRLLAGCAPCQPFSKLTRAIKKHECWDLLDNFGRFVEGIEPEFVTMENVPELADRGQDVFVRFLSRLEKKGYFFDWEIVRCEEYGVPQSRRRLVLLASLLGEISVPQGRYRKPTQWKTVRKTIGLHHQRQSDNRSFGEKHGTRGVDQGWSRTRSIGATPGCTGNDEGDPRHLSGHRPHT